MPTATQSRCPRMTMVRSPRRCLGGRRPWMGGDARWRGRCAVARPSAAAQRASSGSDCGARRLSDETRRSLRIWALTDLELAPRAYPWLKRFAKRIQHSNVAHAQSSSLKQCPVALSRLSPLIPNPLQRLCAHSHKYQQTLSLQPSEVPVTPSQPICTHSEAHNTHVTHTHTPNTKRGERRGRLLGLPLPLCLASPSRCSVTALYRLTPPPPPA